MHLGPTGHATWEAYLGCMLYTVLYGLYRTSHRLYDIAYMIYDIGHTAMMCCGY